MNAGYKVLPSVDDAPLMLALLNTTPTVEGVGTDLLGDAAGARAWLADHAPDAPAQTDPARLRSVRDALQAAVDGSAADGFEEILAGARLEPSVGGDELTWRLVVAGDRELAVRAILAWDALRRTAPGRLRRCANDECTLFLIDSSKNNSARWCSMASCGNRLKARRHYQRRRS